MTSPSTAEPEPTTGTSPRARADVALLLRRLTPREAQVLARFAAGEDLRTAARSLGIAPNTARSHLNRAIRKLGVRTPEEAVALTTAPPPAPAPASAPEPAPEPADEPADESAPASFEEFAALVHARLAQQTFLLTGHRRRAVHSTHLALGAAARRWAEVSATADPEGWVRTKAFDLALSPWRRGGPRRARPSRWPRRRIAVGEAAAPAGPEPSQRLTPRDRALLKALLRLSRPQRRALVLHDTLGLPAERVAVEVESSTAAAAARVRSAREALARELPELLGADPEDPEFAERLAGLLHAAAVHGCPDPRLPSPARLVADSRLHTGLATGAAAALTVLAGAALVTTGLGVGPSALVRPELPAGTACTSPWTGSAGPAVPRGAPGLQTPWCSPAPGVPARLTDPAGPAGRTLPTPAPSVPTGDPETATGSEPSGSTDAAPAGPPLAAPRRT
ncbi:LuxR C-terminal-related transcriptional regulator [Streptomyces sp. TLI_171]|uniref:LuxR C-terminal-related transcriptional regulator n=1 Tax=Streptomyces sp. TLI_171 TaxID=1938859 RepID=UPI000C42CAEA|nr:LuxR C-terminal-related transcriptional regulator [Streptomyces sp. TLI_171]RKE19476.1 DNA-directed RNA polymerase specialized sigma24 family protein [Streptomyces sp. TLI_171]